jgi:hypothetical protein
MSIVLAFMSAVLMSGAAPAAEGADAKAAPTVKRAEADPVVCKSYDQLGSRIAQKRICKKTSEWQVDDAEARGERINQLNRLRGTGSPTG